MNTVMLIVLFGALAAGGISWFLATGIIVVHARQSWRRWQRGRSRHPHRTIPLAFVIQHATDRTRRML